MKNFILTKRKMLSLRSTFYCSFHFIVLMNSVLVKPIIAFVITNIVVIHTEQIYFFETHIYSKYYCLNTKFVSYPCHPSYINVSRTILIIIINIVITFAAGIGLLPSTCNFLQTLYYSHSPQSNLDSNVILEEANL